MGDEMLQTALATFERQKGELLQSAAGKWVLIYGEQIVSTFETRNDGLREGYRRFGHTAFLVHPVRAGQPVAHARTVSVVPLG